MFKKRSGLLWALLITIFLISSLAFVRQGDLYFQIKKQLTIFGDVYKEVATMYVEEVSPERIMRSGVNAMLRELDPYTVFIDEGEQQQMEIISQGTYGGIGLDAGFRGDQIVVIAPLEGYPAERAGIRSGDVILSINEVAVEGMNPDEVQQLTIGDAGTEVSLTIRRSGIEEPIRFDLVRERIEVKNIEYSGLIEGHENLAYLQLTRFGQRSAEEIREKLLGFKDQGSLDGLILDLRNNPGGLLNEAVEIVDKFVEPGVTVVETKGRMANQNTVFVTDEPAVFEDLPIVVLMNRGSASASEVVAGALQDLDRAVVVGQTSFGKGLVQTVRPLSYNTSLKITISQYYIPSGRSIQSVDYAGENGIEGRQIPDSLRRAFTTKNGRTVYDGLGIEPDIKVDEGEDSRARVALLQNNKFFFFTADYIAEHGEDEEPEDAYEKFLDYLERENFSYQLSADQHLEQLLASSEQFHDEAESAHLIRALERSVERKKDEDLRNNREFIEQKLTEEWAAQTGSAELRAQNRLRTDRSVQEAIRLIGDIEGYHAILNP
ncbi:S41 family peptidase [Rhodohalobacter sp. SW132]|uniref:S41 family peptidase n=1 Tax=Rhodohalobacter sp. SW132 TaxID=2293433 RepID=UPI000E262B1D|nr:S41 family peptidase [Rhodohalobacter sp. SW132]REL33367.1 S41 family peptidase [Rhodohalobacter sp. SW132]